MKGVPFAITVLGAGAGSRPCAYIAPQSRRGIDG